MTIADTYRGIGDSLKDKASIQTDQTFRLHYEVLAQQYYRLALEAEKNDRREVAYGTRGLSPA
jgi:hypothetical protein